MTSNRLNILTDSVVGLVERTVQELVADERKAFKPPVKPHVMRMGYNAVRSAISMFDSEVALIFGTDHMRFGKGHKAANTLPEDARAVFTFKSETDVFNLMEQLHRVHSRMQEEFAKRGYRNRPDLPPSSAISKLDEQRLVAAAAWPFPVSPTQSIAEPDPWRDAVLDACVTSHIGFTEGDAKATLRGLLEWEVKIALDPSVSKAARDLQETALEKGRREGMEQALIQGKAGQNDIAKAFATLKEAIRKDEGYAWGWHCNIAMPIMDELKCSHQAANVAAAKIMLHVFDTDMMKYPQFTSLARQWVMNKDSAGQALQDAWLPQFAPKPDMTKALADVVAERASQIDQHGRTTAQDDQWQGGELASAAAAYATFDFTMPLRRETSAMEEGQWYRQAPVRWPFAPHTFNPKGVRSNMVKAAAMLLAEIERMDRADAKAAAIKRARLMRGAE